MKALSKPSTSFLKMEILRFEKELFRHKFLENSWCINFAINFSLYKRKLRSLKILSLDFNQNPSKSLNEKPLQNTQNWPKSEPKFDPNLPKDTMRKKFAFKIHSKISKMTPKTKNTSKFDHFRVQFKDPYFSKDAMRKKIRSKKPPKTSPENPKMWKFLQYFLWPTFLSYGHFRKP